MKKYREMAVLRAEQVTFQSKLNFPFLVYVPIWATDRGRHHFPLRGGRSSQSNSSIHVRSVVFQSPALEG